MQISIYILLHIPWRRGCPPFWGKVLSACLQDPSIQLHLIQQHIPHHLWLSLKLRSQHFHKHKPSEPKIKLRSLLILVHIIKLLIKPHMLLTLDYLCQKVIVKYCEYWPKAKINWFSKTIHCHFRFPIPLFYYIWTTFIIFLGTITLIVILTINVYYKNVDRNSHSNCCFC